MRADFRAPKAILAGFMMLLCACGGPKSFKVTIDAETLGTQQLTVVYTLPDGNRAVLQPTAVDGHVEFSGSASELSTVEVFTSSGAKLVKFAAVNGEKIAITFDDDNTPVIKGAENQISDSITLMPDTAKFVAPSVILDRDSSITWQAEGIWVFTSTEKERTQAVMDTIKAHKKSVRDVFVNANFDTWRDICRRDSATWKQGILPEGPVDVAALSSTPLLIEVDSAGTILRKIPL